MLFGGTWHLCDDAFVRPVLRCEIQAADGTWHQAPFLIDTGADRTVLSADVARPLGLSANASSDRLGGVGGAADSVVFQTKIAMRREDGSAVHFDGQFAAFTDPSSLDMSVLGRDITNLFAVIVDRPQDVVCLIGREHRYRIEKS
jgi:hypothetical protein